MNVGINTLFLIPGEVGGSERYLRETLAAMAANHRDVRLTLFTNRENDALLHADLDRHAQVRFVPTGVNASNRVHRILAEQLLLPRHVRRAAVDLLWSPGYTAPLLTTCPQVLSILDMQYKRFPQDLTALARLTTDVLVRLGARRCTRTIAISNFTRSEIARFTAARPERIDVTYLAADPALAEPCTAAERDHLLAPALGDCTAPYFLCVSNSYPHKNLHLLVKAFGTAMASLPHRLVLIGKPRLGEAALAQSIRALPDPGRILRLTDGVGARALACWYQQATACVLPSLYEGFGLPILETMMAGTPLLAARQAAIPEIAGDYALYFEGHDPAELARRLTDVAAWSPSDRDRWCRSARAWAQEFSWNRTATETLASLARALPAYTPP